MRKNMINDYWIERVFGIVYQACDLSGFYRNSGFLKFFAGKSISEIHEEKIGGTYNLHLFY